VPSHDAPAGSAGFTLVEVLVALVVASLLMAILFNSALGTRDRARKAAQKQAAILLADTLATEAGTGSFAPGTRVGRSGKLEWQVAESALASDPRGFFTLADITVHVTGDQHQTLYALDRRVLKPVAVQ
jgi:prepilin-type N-terminal cleavage/methylation domain-containing protein